MALGCSKTPASPEGPAAEAPSVTPVLEAGWGKSDGQLGQNVPEEGLPEGPKSFVADATGAVHVLDQENARVQKFSAGQLAASVPIPARAFDDVELFGAGGYALLDVHAPAAIVFVDATGATRGERPLESAEIPEPTLITGLTRGEDGFYVEVSDDYLVRVADAAGEPVEATVVPGQALDGGAALKAELADAHRVALFRVALPEGEPSALADVTFGERVARRTLLAGRKGGGVLLGVVTETEPADPATPAVESSSLVVVDATGHEKHRIALPTASSAADTFRTVKRGEDGNVYAMVVAASGIQIVRVAP